MFPQIEYLEWIMEKSDAVTHDLALSDLGSPYEPLVPPEIRDLPDPPEKRTLESLVAEQYGPEVQTENVLVTAGTTQANFITAAVLVGQDSDVLVEEPGYEPLVASPEGFGANVRRFPRHPSEGYALNPETVAEALAPTVDLVTVTNRHNPSGRLTPRETFEAAAQTVADVGSRLLVDEVYAPFVSDPKDGEDTAFGSVTAAGLDGVVATQSLNKFHGYPGLRIGWLVSDSGFVERADRMLTHIPDVATPSREMARRILLHREPVAERSRTRLIANHEKLRSFVHERDDLEGFVAPGNTLAYLEHSEADGDEVVEAALDADLLLVPGRFFGDRGGFRISAARSPDSVADALEVFGKVLDGLSS